MFIEYVVVFKLGGASPKEDTSLLGRGPKNNVNSSKAFLYRSHGQSAKILLDKAITQLPLQTLYGHFWEEMLKSVNIKTE